MCRLLLKSKYAERKKKAHSSHYSRDSMTVSHDRCISKRDSQRCNNLVSLCYKIPYFMFHIEKVPRTSMDRYNLKSYVIHSIHDIQSTACIFSCTSCGPAYQSSISWRSDSWYEDGYSFLVIHFTNLFPLKCRNGDFYF